MRIIAGSRKGARIFAPKGTGTRPTGDRVREAAFNLLGPGSAEDATVLDLFAGSGAIGLEALSRGAAHATFVESDREACRTINRNLDKLGFGAATVLCQDALTALRADARTGRRYDLVLVDPPYRRFSSLQNALIQHLPDVLAPDGVLLVETAADEEPDLPPLRKRTSRRYGSARLTLFEHEDAAE
jgi:16S rRNA (guanine966-N2)-methyltransferase